MAAAALAQVGIVDKLYARTDRLSGGQQQRVALARVLVQDPAIILADEPTGNLDSANGGRILQLLRELSDETGTALLMVTHSNEAASICHRVLYLLDGRVTREEMGE